MRCKSEVSMTKRTDYAPYGVQEPPKKLQESDERKPFVAEIAGKQ